MKTVWRVLVYLKRYPWLAAGTLTCAVLGTLMVIIFPTVTKWIINDVVRANHPEKLLPLILLAAVAFLLQHAFNALRIVLNNTFEQKVIFDLRSDLYSHIQLLPLRWFDNRGTGDECASARQSFRGSSNQELRARERRARALQSSKRSVAACHACRHAGLGNLQPIDVDV